MNTVASNDTSIQHVRVTDDEIISQLADGRVISVPLAWSWRLSEATPAQRANWRLIGSGQGVHWPDLDEDLSVEGMLHGVPAHRPQVAIVKQRKAGRRKPPCKGAQSTEKKVQLRRRPNRAADGTR